MKKLLCRVNTLIPQKKNLKKVALLLDDFNTSPHTLSKEISKNLSLLAKVFAIANSPFFGLVKRVSAIEFAIMTIGFEEIRNVTAALLAWESLDLNDRQKSIIKYSVLSSRIARKIAMDYGLAKSAEAGLIALFANSIFISSQKITEEIENNNFSHYEASAFVLEKWNFPQIITNGIKNFEKPELAEGSYTITSVANLASYIAADLLGLKENWRIEDPSLYVLEKLGLEEEKKLKEFRDTYEESFLVMKKSLDSDEDLF
ncbi:MAG: HDOD domain-containing protein [Burkholderiales bacterium]|nr:HDOD domain-containing protein [Burkholderiales bacterium]